MGLAIFPDSITVPNKARIKSIIIHDADLA